MVMKGPLGSGKSAVLQAWSAQCADLLDGIHHHEYVADETRSRFKPIGVFAGLARACFETGEISPLGDLDSLLQIIGKRLDSDIALAALVTLVSLVKFS